MFETPNISKAKHSNNAISYKILTEENIQDMY